MTDRDAFLRAIRADPDADTPRLVYADWLDDHGDHAEAEYVRVQVELEPVRHRLEDRRTRELIRREEVIEAEHRDGRFGAAFEFDDGLTHPEGVGFRRGLPDWLLVSLDTLLSRGDRLLAAYPTVRELAVYDIEGRGAELATCPLLARFDTLELADVLTEDDAAALAASPHIGPAQRLKVWAGWNTRLAELAAGRGRPAAVEVVQLLGGLCALFVEQNAADLDRSAREAITHINRRGQRLLARLSRPFARLFSLYGDPHALPDGSPCEPGAPVGCVTAGQGALVVDYGDNGVRVTFRPDGELQALHDFEGPIPDAERPTPGLLRVREFEAIDWVGVSLWGYGRADDYLRSPSTRPDAVSVADWRRRGGTLSRWLREENFYLEWCESGHRMDWRGRQQPW